MEDGQVIEFVIPTFNERVRVTADLKKYLAARIPALITGVKTQATWSPKDFVRLYGHLACIVDDSSGKIKPYKSTIAAFFEPWITGIMVLEDGLLCNKASNSSFERMKTRLT